MPFPKKQTKFQMRHCFNKSHSMYSFGVKVGNSNQEIQSYWYITNLGQELKIYWYGREWRRQWAREEGEVKRLSIWVYMTIQVTNESSSTVSSVLSVIWTLYKLICDIIQECKWTMYLSTDKNNLSSWKWLTICLKNKQ